jgi:hypothetical protein
VFTVHFTEDVTAEAIYHLRRNHPTWDGGRITDIRNKIENTMDSRVDKYPNDGSFPGIDEHDQHVHAAAVHAQMDIILTCDAGFANLGDEVLNGLPYEVYHPDDFFILIDACAPEAVQRVTDQQWRYYHARIQDVRLPQQLKRAECPCSPSASVGTSSR